MCASRPGGSVVVSSNGTAGAGVEGAVPGQLVETSRQVNTPLSASRIETTENKTPAAELQAVAVSLSGSVKIG